MIKSKLLSDSGWRDVAAKNKVKDNGLLKSLEKWKRLDDEAHDEAAKVLDEIAKLAGSLKKDKAVAAVPPAAKYLGEMLGEVPTVARDVAKSKAEHDKAQKAKAEADRRAAAKNAEDDDEDEDDESPELLTTKLKPLLKLVAKGQTMHTLMAKSGKKVVVMLSRKPISPARRKMLAEELGGGSTKYYPGTCSLEAGATTFALKSEVAGMAKLVKLALLEQTGLRINKVKCRGEDGDDDDEDDDEAGKPEAKPTDAKAEKAPAGKGAPGAPGAPDAPGSPGTPGAAPPDACVTPDATDTDCFFDHDSAKLTASDETFLQAYAKSYLGSQSTETITLEGWASVDGDNGRNETLAKERAASVERYLIAQKVPKARLKATGKGPTDKFPGTLCENRRVTVQPKLDLKVRDFVEVTQEEPGNVPIPGKKPSGSLGEKAPEVDVTKIDLPKPREMVSRDVVRDALKDWLLDLGKSQKVKARESDVILTDRVHVAEETLLGRLGKDADLLDQPGVTPFNGDGSDWRAAKLADHIANNLPEQIPKVNFDNFLKLRSVNTPKEKTWDEGLREKAEKLADQVLSDFKVPQKYWKDIKDAVKKRIPGLLDKLPDDVKEAAKKAYDKLVKQEDSAKSE